MLLHSETIKSKFIEYFKKKGHIVIPNHSLIPENDPSTLFIIAGVHPIVPYILAGSHPEGKRLCNIQRCFRTIDIEETGDIRHLTFMEMLGNWSLGDYFKKESLNWSIELLVNEFGLDIHRIYATVFSGNNNIPVDKEAIQIWTDIFKKYGIDAKVYDGKNNNDPNVRIFPLGEKDNFWGPAGETGPCGPSSEIYYYLPKEKPDLAISRPGFKDTNTFYEFWNNVFMQYNKNKEGKFEKLKKHTVDTGMGFERLCMIVQNRNSDGSLNPEISIYNTDLFESAASYLRTLIEDESRPSTLKENIKKYPAINEFDPTLTDLEDIPQAIKSFRIILDHARASVFLIADGVEPSNKESGYVLRRLIRRTIRHARLLQIKQNFTKDIARLYIDKYKLQYPNLEDNAEKIINILEKEETSFEQTVERGIKELEKLSAKGEKINGKKLFSLFETYGFPLEIALDHLGVTNEKTKATYEKDFLAEQSLHQKDSRKGAEKKFKGGLADNTAETTRYHTATHLLLRALQIILGDHVHQKGSNITKERLRFDFSHPDKLTKDQIKKIEQIVNKAINDNLTVEKQDMSKEEALKLGAEHEFDKSYPETVIVYFIKNPKTGEEFSKELCGGPHVKSTSELAKSGKFKIIKEESSGAGIRRIKAVLV